MKKLILMIFLLVADSNGKSFLRNPFSYERKFIYKAYGMLNNNCCFGIIYVNNKRYRVKKGDKICGYNISDITYQTLELKNDKGYKKSLQLK